MVDGHTAISAEFEKTDDRSEVEQEAMYTIPDDKFDGSYLLSRGAPLLTETDEIHMGETMIEHAVAVSRILVRTKEYRHLVYERLQDLATHPSYIKQTLLFDPKEEKGVLEKLQNLQKYNMATISGLLTSHPLIYPEVQDIFKESETVSPSRLLMKHHRDWTSVRQDLCMANIRLVWHVSTYFTKQSAVGRSRLMSSGIMGLLIAIDRFWPGNNKFATFATWWIRQKMEREVKQYKEEQSAESAHGTQPIISLDQVDDESGFNILSTVKGREEREIGKDADVRTTLIESMRILSDRQKFILCMRNGMDMRGIVDPAQVTEDHETIVPGECYTLKNIAKFIGISKERVRNIQDQAYARLASSANPQQKTLELFLNGED